MLLDKVVTKLSEEPFAPKDSIFICTHLALPMARALYT